MNNIKTGLLFLTVAIIKLEGCSQTKTIYTSGNLSGIDYIMIKKRTDSKNDYVITIKCNQYFTGNGYGMLLIKEKYNSEGKYSSTFHLIRDSVMLNNMHYSQKTSNAPFQKLSLEEYETIKTALSKYPALVNKYSLNPDSLKNYWGWYELEN